jgi:hypothetical protein
VVQARVVHERRALGQRHGQRLGLRYIVSHMSTIIAAPALLKWAISEPCRCWSSYLKARIACALCRSTPLALLLGASGSNGLPSTASTRQQAYRTRGARCGHAR